MQKDVMICVCLCVISDLLGHCKHGCSFFSFLFLLSRFGGWREDAETRTQGDVQPLKSFPKSPNENKPKLCEKSSSIWLDFLLTFLEGGVTSGISSSSEEEEEMATHWKTSAFWKAAVCKPLCSLGVSGKYLWIFATGGRLCAKYFISISTTVLARI